MTKRIVSLVLCFLLLSVNISAAEEINVEFDATSIVHSDTVSLMNDKKDNERDIEDVILQGWDNFSKDINVREYRLTQDEAKSIYAKAYYENPLYWYIELSYSLSMSGGFVSKIIPRYKTTDRNEISKIRDKIDSATEEILLNISPNMTDYEKIMAVHDYMVLNYTYDITDTAQDVSVIYDKTGVCTAYSMAFIHMMNVLGIDATIITSERMVHAWNLVRLDGEWYHMDVTWDDPDWFGIVVRDYALLSTQAIIEKEHTGFDTGDYNVTSTLYDDKKNVSVYVSEMSYEIDGNRIVDENGRVIFDKLDGGDSNWSIGGRYMFPNSVYASMCEINGKLYFNTDTGIYCYDTENDETTLLKKETGVCGLFADKNVLRYAKFDITSNNFVEGGSITVSNLKFSEAGYENGVLVQHLYNGTDSDVWIISKGEGYMMEPVKSGEAKTAEFANGEDQRVFIWTSNMQPIQ